MAGTESASPQGEKSTTVVFWKFQNDTNDTKEGQDGETPSSSRLPFTRGYAVFNAAQVDEYTPKPESDLPMPERIERAEGFFRSTGADVSHGGNRAYYAPATDHIQMPPFGAFDENVAYYSTLAHEHTHWTANFTREGVFETFDYIRRLTGFHVQFESYTEAHFRTTGPAGELMLAIAAWIAKQERTRIAESTRAGVERARRQGKHIGRPKAMFRRDLARELRAEGLSWSRIAAQLGVPVSTLRDACRADLAESPRATRQIHDGNDGSYASL